MKPTNGLYLFVMSAGEYSDYGVNGLWAGPEPVSKDQWLSFMSAEIAVRAAKRAELVTKPYVFRHLDPHGSDEYMAQYKEYQAWLKARKSIESMFASAYNLTQCEYEEFHLDD